MVRCDGSYSGLEIWGIVALVFTALALLYLLLRILREVYRKWLGPAMGKNIKVENMGKWAVITGASDGIGKCLAHEVAKRNVNVVLISRTLSKLQAVADEIAAQHKVETKIIAADFTSGYDLYDKIKPQLSGLEIGTLINNVGMFHMQNTYYHKVKDIDKLCLDMIHCNIFSAQFMTNMVLPQMVARKKGLILNISSLSGVLPAPFHSVYGATKAYMQKFSVDLNLEYSKSGVFIQCVSPGGVATEANITVEKGQSNLMTPKPEVYTQCIMKSLGMSDDTSAYFPHSLMRFNVWLMSSLIPVTTRKLMRSYVAKNFVKGDVTNIA